MAKPIFNGIMPGTETGLEALLILLADPELFRARLAELKAERDRADEVLLAAAKARDEAEAALADASEKLAQATKLQAAAQQDRRDAEQRVLQAKQVEQQLIVERKELDARKADIEAREAELGPREKKLDERAVAVAAMQAAAEKLRDEYQQKWAQLTALVSPPKPEGDG